MGNRHGGERLARDRRAGFSFARTHQRRARRSGRPTPRSAGRTSRVSPGTCAPPRRARRQAARPRSDVRDRRASRAGAARAPRPSPPPPPSRAGARRERASCSARARPGSPPTSARAALLTPLGTPRRGAPRRRTAQVRRPMRPPRERSSSTAALLVVVIRRARRLRTRARGTRAVELAVVRQIEGDGGVVLGLQRSASARLDIARSRVSSAARSAERMAPTRATVRRASPRRGR